MIEFTSNNCIGCSYLSSAFTCESPTCCVRRKIAGTDMTVLDVMKDLNYGESIE